jgi:transcriptional regulator with XRE-family HTH domain
MARKGMIPQGKRPYLREWREHSAKTLAKVAAELEEFGGDLPTTAASISRIEQGKQPYSEPVLNALAAVYGCEEVGELFYRNPLKAGVVVHFMDYTKDEVEQAKAILEALRKKG